MPFELRPLQLLVPLFIAVVPGLLGLVAGHALFLEHTRLFWGAVGLASGWFALTLGLERRLKAWMHPV